MNRHYRDALPVRLYESDSSAATVTARFGLDPTALVDFSLNINPFGPPDAAVTAARAALERCNEYPDLRLGALRRVLARRHDVAEDALFFGAGLDDVIKLLVQALTSEDGKVLIHLPTFPRYELEVRLRGARPVLVENEPPWRVRREGIEAELAAGDVELAFLCSPNNPTGEVLPGEWIAGLAEQHANTVFVVDEALIHPATQGVLACVRASPNVIVLRTFSKYFGLAGVRIGYAVGPVDILQTVERGRPPFNVTHTAEVASLAAVGDPVFLDRCAGTFGTESAWFRGELATMPHLAVRGYHANMVLVESLRLPLATLVERLGRQGLLVADATCFGGFGTHAVFRVSLRDRRANERLVQTLEELA